MTARPRERIGTEHRLRSTLEYSVVKREGAMRRGRHFVLLSLERPGLPTKVGFIASRKSVGGAVLRNRARRRMREIVRRRWPEVDPRGHWLVFIAGRGVLTASHASLAQDLETVMREVGALRRQPR